MRYVNQFYSGACRSFIFTGLLFPILFFISYFCHLTGYTNASISPYEYPRIIWIYVRIVPAHTRIRLPTGCVYNSNRFFKMFVQNLNIIYHSWSTVINGSGSVAVLSFVPLIRIFLLCFATFAFQHPLYVDNKRENWILIC